jgi:outer membrane protein TolC
MLEISQTKEKERLELNSVLGFPPDFVIPLEPKMEIPSAKALPSLSDIMEDLEGRRLDLLALKMGYQSQEANVRAAILAQFPAISLGVTHARDTSNVITTGFNVSISLPLFDRNQGQIAMQEATRQRLFDEYMNRIFKARANVAEILANIQSVEEEIAAGEEAFKTAQELLRNSRDSYLERNIDALTYYNEIEKSLTKQVEVLKLRRDLADLHIALELAAGAYLGQIENKAEDRK